MFTNFFFKTVSSRFHALGQRMFVETQMNNVNYDREIVFCLITRVLCMHEVVTSIGQISLIRIVLAPFGANKNEILPLSFLEMILELLI